MAHDPFYDLITPRVHKPIMPHETALLTIDLQYLDAHPSGWMGRLCQERGMPHHLDERWSGITDILPKVRALQDACRAVGTEVIHIRVAYATNNQRDGGRSLALHASPIPYEPRDDEFLPEVAPVGDEIVLSKTSAGAFNSTAIDQLLRNLGIRQLLVTGIVTEGCVELTARDASDRGYAVTLIADACASSTYAAHVDALQRMGDGGMIRVRDSTEVLNELLSVEHSSAVHGAQ